MVPIRLIRALRPVRSLHTRQVVRWLRRALAVSALLAIAGAVAELMLHWPAHTGTGRDVPTLTVVRSHFVRRVTAEGNLRAVKATPLLIPGIEGLRGNGLKLAWLAQDGTPVKAGDVVVRFERADAERLLREAEVELESAGVRLQQEQLRASSSDARMEDQATLARQGAEQARRNQATDPLLSSKGEIAESAIDEQLASARQAQAEFARQIYRKVAHSDVELAAIYRRRAQVALDDARTALASLEVHAPGDGVFVIRRNDHGDIPHLGAQLSPGETIGEIPLIDAMEAELFVLEVDGSGLEVGQAAEVIVESNPDAAYRGTVRLVDKLAKPREPGVLLQYFSAVVAFDHTDRAVMKPGQRVRATLVLDQRDAIVVPRQAVVERAGKTMVYRRDAHGFTPVPVEVGTAMPGRVAIASGLADGDVIAERDPTRTSDPEPAAGAGSAAQPAKGTP